MVGTVLLALGLLLVSLGVGFLASIVVVLAADAILGPMRPEDDESLRQAVPAGLAYLVWAATALAAFIAGWRRLRETP